MLSKYLGPGEIPSAGEKSIPNEIRPVSSVPSSPLMPPMVQPGSSPIQTPDKAPEGVFCSATPFDITSAQEFLQVLHYNPRRKYLLIQNTTIASLNNDGTIQIILDDAPALGSPSIKRSITLSAGGAWEPLKCPTNPITIRTISTLAEGVVIEGQ